MIYDYKNHHQYFSRALPRENHLVLSMCLYYFSNITNLENLMIVFAVHYQKIIHRDIKPSNLLRADSGQVRYWNGQRSFYSPKWMFTASLQN